VISARSKMLGAVSMVEMALKSLSEKNVVELDDSAGRHVSNSWWSVLGEGHRDRDAGTLYT